MQSRMKEPYRKGVANRLASSLAEAVVGGVSTFFVGRVEGEARRKPTSSPLVEPDVRISRIRLSQKRSAESTRRQLHGPGSEKLQPETLKVRIVRDPFRRSEGPLAAPP